MRYLQSICNWLIFICLCIFCLAAQTMLIWSLYHIWTGTPNAQLEGPPIFYRIVFTVCILFVNAIGFVIVSDSLSHFIKPEQADLDPRWIR